MPAANPLVEDAAGEAPSLWSFGGNASAGVAGTTVGGSVSAGSGAADSNLHLWVAAVMLVCLGGIIAAKTSGFRFFTDIGVTGK